MDNKITFEYFGNNQISVSWCSTNKDKNRLRKEVWGLPFVDHKWRGDEFHPAVFGEDHLHRVKHAVRTAQGYYDHR